MDWNEGLPKNRRRGSRPRCLALMDGRAAVVSDRLTKMIAVEGVRITPDAVWKPSGIPMRLPDGGWDTSATAELILTEAKGFLSDDQKDVLTDWWLEIADRANTPNWDIAST